MSGLTTSALLFYMKLTVLQHILHCCYILAEVHDNNTVNCVEVALLNTTAAAQLNQTNKIF